MSDSQWWPDDCMPMDIEMKWPDPPEFVIPVRYGGMDIRRPSVLVHVTEATQASDDLQVWHRTVANLVSSVRRSVYGPHAPVRRRPKRVAKKIARRGGYLRPGSLGAELAGIIRMVRESDS